MAETPQFVAGSHGTITLTYTAGPFGIDDTGGLKISWMNSSDFSTPQFDQPDQPNYTTVTASNGAQLQLMFNRRLNRRPWANTLFVRVQRGFLSEGDTVTVTFGDRSQGSPGFRMQTNCEKGFQLKVFADVFATYTWEALADSPVLELIPGPASFYRLVGPTLRKPDEPFRLAIVPTDCWGNPTSFSDDEFTLRCNGDVANLPGRIQGARCDSPLVLDDLTIRAPGDYRFDLRRGDDVVAESAPLRISDQYDVSHFWGDLHGQSQETVGSGSARDYFEFARDRAFVDATAHQGNDFQITDSFWAELQEMCDEFNEDGKFVVLPGYEWSGNTGTGGDRNVLYRQGGQEILRSSKVLVTPEEATGPVCENIETLHRALDPSDTIVIPHVGGRYADIYRAQSPELERSVEIHSTWGTFEWLLHDAFALGQRVGVICHSDDHKGRPGAAYPGAKQFGAMGGLTCYLSKALTRDGIFNALAERKHFGTTGTRMFIDVTATANAPMLQLASDGATGDLVAQAQMGDIVETPATSATFDFEVVTQSPIERICVFRKDELLHVFRPEQEGWSGRRIRVLGEGAAFKGRGREVPWDSTLRFDAARVQSASYVNVFQPDRKPEFAEDGAVRWSTVTTGNFSGVDLLFDTPVTGRLQVESNQVSGTVDCADLSSTQDAWLDAGGIGRGIRVVAMPDQLTRTAFSGSCPVELLDGDTPIYLRVTQEDGHQGWSSPIYLCRRGGAK